MNDIEETESWTVQGSHEISFDASSISVEIPIGFYGDPTVEPVEKAFKAINLPVEIESVEDTTEIGKVRVVLTEGFSTLGYILLLVRD